MRNRRQLDFTFPYQGIHEGRSLEETPVATSVDLLNVRVSSPKTERDRGSQRAGLSKIGSDQVSGSNPIQDINHIVASVRNAASASRLAIRKTTGVVVSNGVVRTFDPKSGQYNTVVNGTGNIDANAPVVFSSPLFANLFFADGANRKYFDSETGFLNTWNATSGTFPGNDVDYPRLIATWRGRIVLSGFKTDPHNWYMSAVGDAFNWDTAPSQPSPTQAVAGNNAPAGELGDIINTIIPWDDDTLFFGCDHSIYRLTNDPAAGGRFDLISDTIGMAWGRPWCKGDDDTLYFFSSRGGVYRMSERSNPQRLSDGPLEKAFQSIDFDSHIVRMEWNDEALGVQVFITPLNSAVATFNYFYDAENDAWFRDKFGNAVHNPRATHVFDGDRPGDRVLIVGGNDGRLRKIDQDARHDDGTAIESYVYLGPIKIQGGTLPFVISEFQVRLTDQSDDLTVDIYAGNTAEDAYSATNDTLLLETGSSILLENGDTLAMETFTADYTGTVSAIRANSQHPRVRGYVAFIKIGTTGSATGAFWEFDGLLAMLSVPRTSRRRLFA